MKKAKDSEDRKEFGLLCSGWLSEIEGNADKADFVPAKANVGINAYSSGLSADEEGMDTLFGKKVLLVEDNKINQFVISRYLKKWGLAVKKANNGREAVEMASEELFDLIITDLRMPVMDGYEASRRIRELNYYYQQLPIVALTAYNAPGMKEQTQKAGITDCLLKPFKPEILYTLISKLLKKEQEVSLYNPLRQRLETTVDGDEQFKDELMRLFLSSFRDLLAALNDGSLLNVEYLNKTRHMHKTTFYMLQLNEYETALIELQDKLERGGINTPAVKQSIDLLSVLSERLINELEEYFVRQRKAV